jgi:ZU5 domain
MMGTSPSVVRSAFVALVVACVGVSAACGSSGSPAERAVGAAGGTVEGDGVKLTVPAGAVEGNVTFSITPSSTPPPDTHTALSPMFVFGPEGISFAVPVTVEMAFSGDATGASLIWSTRAGDGFESVGGTAEAGKMTAQVTHFSRGFVGRLRAASVGDAGEDAEVARDGQAGTDATTTDGAPPADGGADSGSCGCAPSLTCCSGACVDVRSSNGNCGGCGRACPTGESCVQSTCAAGCAPLGQSCASLPCCGGTCLNGTCLAGG